MRTFLSRTHFEWMKWLRMTLGQRQATGERRDARHRARYTCQRWLFRSFFARTIIFTLIVHGVSRDSTLSMKFLSRDRQFVYLCSTYCFVSHPSVPSCHSTLLIPFSFPMIQERERRVLWGNYYPKFVLFIALSQNTAWGLLKGDQSVVFKESKGIWEETRRSCLLRIEKRSFVTQKGKRGRNMTSRCLLSFCSKCWVMLLLLWSSTQEETDLKENEWVAKLQGQDRNVLSLDMGSFSCSFFFPWRLKRRKENHRHSRKGIWSKEVRGSLTFSLFLAELWRKEKSLEKRSFLLPHKFDSRFGESQEMQCFSLLDLEMMYTSNMSWGKKRSICKTVMNSSTRLTDGMIVCRSERVTYDFSHFGEEERRKNYPSIMKEGESDTWRHRKWS